MDNLKTVEGFAMSEPLDNQAATDARWLAALMVPLLYGERVRCKIRANGKCHAAVRGGGIFGRAGENNGRRGIDEYLKPLACFSPTKS